MTWLIVAPAWVSAIAWVLLALAEPNWSREARGYLDHVVTVPPPVRDHPAPRLPAQPMHVLYRYEPPTGMCDHPVTGRFDVVTSGRQRVGRFDGLLAVCLDCHQITAPQEDTHP